MTNGDTLRIRRSITDLQKDYDNGNKKPLEDLMRAWKGVKDLPPSDPNSFFVIGGYHGEPFRGAGWGNVSYWGGYCNHGNVLFPTWHRVYVLRLEDALRSIPGCADVTQPYWDETSDDTLNNGVPWALTREKFELDGVLIDNPLRSFKFPRNIVDHIPQDNLPGDNPNYNGPNYSKPAGYGTVRYPLSGLVGTPEDREATRKHNEPYVNNYDLSIRLLNTNIETWLKSEVVVKGKIVPNAGSILEQYKECLNAPNYTVFSNTTSRTEWNDNLDSGAKPVVSLESPHNHIHLAVGGYDAPNADYSPIAGANGDMGENDTAALDPIFFFHHCFVDRVFWLWQKRHGFTKHFDIIPGYPGTNSVDSQGPTPGMAPNSWLTLESPLDPFRKIKDGRDLGPYTSLDCIDIENQVGYTYGPGSLEGPVALAAAGGKTKTVHVRRVNRGGIRGSFLISGSVIINGETHFLGSEAVLSRWHVEGCVNCQKHLEAAAFFSLDRLPTGLAANVTAEHVKVEIRTRDKQLRRIAAAAALPEPRYDVEVR